MMRWSELYKREIRGDDCCGFWRPDNGGICKGWPHKDEHPCPANADGTGCPIFPREEDVPPDIATALRLMGKKGVATVWRNRYPGIDRVSVDGEYFGLWDRCRAGFAELAD